jgi:glycosyltransferase involved in cell wall biosynthesis
MRPLKVLHLLWNGEIGGAERAVVQLVKEQMRDSSLAPALAFGNGTGVVWEQAKQLGCPVIDFGMKSGRQLFRLPEVARQLSEYDIHHFHFPMLGLMLSSLFTPAAKRIYTHRSGRRQQTLYRWCVNQLAGLVIRNYIHAISGNTAHAAQAAAELFKLKPDNVLITYNGLDFELLLSDRSQNEIKQKLGIQDKNIVVGTAAILRKPKRVDWLIEAMARIRSQAWHLLIIGDGPDRERLERLARKALPDDRVHFIGLQTNVVPWMRAIDIFVLPSQTESFGNALVEAMAIGIPGIVMKDSGGLLEHVKPEINGLIASDIPDLSEKINELIACPAKRTSLGTAGKQYVIKQYTLQAMSRQYSRLYSTVRSTTRMNS